MTISHNRVTVGTSPTLIFSEDPDGAYVHIQISSGGAVAIGDADVTVSTGHNRPASSHIDLQVGPGESIYGIVASGTVVVSYFATMNQ